MRFGLFILAAVLAACGGCTAFSDPRTEISASPLWGFKLHDSKDHVVELRDAEYDPETKRFKVGQLTINGDASTVRLANVQQMDAYNRQLETHGRNIERFGSIVAQLAETIAPLALPGLKLKGPLGGSATVNSAATQSLIEALAPAIEKMVNDAIGKAAVEGKFREDSAPDPAEGAPDPLTP